MTDDPTFTWALGFFAGATAGFWFGVRWRRPPYSSAAIAFRATAEDAAKVRSKIVNPLVWEDPPEQFIRMNESRVQRGNSSGGPTTPRPGVIPNPQMPPARVTDADGCTIGYRPLPQNGPDRDTVAAVRAADAAISDQALQAKFRAWWGTRYPSPPGLGLAMIAVAWGRHLLTRGAATAERFSPPGGQ